MPYQFILGAPIHRNGRNEHEFYSDHADRGDCPNIVYTESRAKRFASQEEAAKAIPLLLAALDNVNDVVRRSMGQDPTKFRKLQDSTPIHILPVEALSETA